MSLPGFPYDPTPPSRPPPAPFLAELYRHLPFLVVHLTVDGIVLHCNPMTTAITGFPETYLVGRNFWAVMFPGKLFAQVPRFISPIAATPLLSDTPMTLKRRDGAERIVAFTRFVHAPCGDPSDSGLKTMVCIGVDLTDRLTNADREKTAPGQNDPGSLGPQVGNGGTIDGEVVTPIAISPPSPIYTSTSGGGATEASAEAIRQAHEHLAQIDARMAALLEAVKRGDAGALSAVSRGLESGGRSGGALDFSARALALEHAAALCDAAPLQAMIGEMLAALYQPNRK